MKIVALDIGGSAIKYACIDENLNITNQGKEPTPLDQIENLFVAFDNIWNKVGDNADGIAVSMPGVIDSEKGIAHTGGALAYITEYPMAEKLKERYHVPVWIGNDAKCAGLAEIGFGELQGVQNGAAIILGSGIGGCIVIDGHVHFGSHLAAGEASWLISDPTLVGKPSDNPYAVMAPYWCMKNGIYGLLSAVQRHLETTERYSGFEIFDMANSGNEKVLAALDEFARDCALQLFNIQVIVDGEKIVIGGGISAQNLLITKIQEQFDKLFNLPGCCITKPEIVAAKYRNDANLVGAYYSLLQIIK